METFEESEEELSDEDPNRCDECTENYYQTQYSEDWIQCPTCSAWLHEFCTIFFVIGASAEKNARRRRGIVTEKCLMLPGIRLFLVKLLPAKLVTDAGNHEHLLALSSWSKVLAAIYLRTERRFPDSSIVRLVTAL
ncbi:unnamed protein product [Acanthoscelides obtectus]|uniref:Uncharacterized protein n=1 Tax=Acanthoscelides obtectus TaxID=200917 RepID=A0A9P0LML6_ACAOB|nr:unnamed protein product [Acanthoscelides obtectus]CAK1671028.1 hypothetical protein AOBTE_LOCUS27995 [Acanthoscelides obtectus]